MKSFNRFSIKMIIITAFIIIVVAIGASTLLSQTPLPPGPATNIGSSFNPTPPPITSTRASPSPSTDIPPEVIQYAKDWPLPNRDYGSTRANKDATINSGNVNSLGVAWQMPIQGSSDWGGAATNPIIMGNNIYFQDLGYNIYSIDFNSGSTKWVQKFNNSYTGPNGVCVGWSKVFATTDLYNLAALDVSTGTMIWNDRISSISPFLKVNAAPVPYGGLVYTSDTFNDALNIGGGIGHFYAFDQSNGAMKWAFSGVDTPDIWGHPDINSGGGAWMPPSVDTNTDRLYWGTKNPGNGQGPNGPYSGTLEFPNGSSRPGANLYTNCLMAFDAKCGKLIWYNQAFPHDLLDHDFQNPPILTTANFLGKNTDIVIGSGKGGIVFAYNRANGGLLWNTPVGKHQYDNLQILPDNPDLQIYPGAMGGILTAPACADNIVFVPYCDLWSKYTSTGLAETQSVNEGTGGLAAIDVNTGSILWNNTLPSLCLGGATVVNDLVFTATFDGTIYAFNEKNGQQVWTWKAPAGITAWPAVARDSIIWPCGYGNNPTLICLRLGSGTPSTPTATTTTPPQTVTVTTTLPPTTITTTPISNNITINYFIKQINNFNITNLWPGTTTFYPSRPPHGNIVNIFVNIDVSNTIINKTGAIPSGGSLVLQCYDSNRNIIGYYCMAKVKGFDPGHNDWFWAHYNPDGTQAVEGKLDYCINCHSQRKDNDYCWTSPISRATSLQPIPDQFPEPLVTPSPTPTPLPSATPIPTIITPQANPSALPSISASPSPSLSPSPVPSLLPSPSPSPSPSVSPSILPSPTPSPSVIPSFPSSPAPSPFPSISPTTSPIPTITESPSPLPSPSPSLFPSPSPSPSPSPVPSLSPSPSPSPSPTVSPTQYTPASGWYNDGPVQYYDFDSNTSVVTATATPAPTASVSNQVPAVGTMYELAYGTNPDGTPDLVPGQHDIIDILPGNPGYSDLWRINLVIVPQTYTPDSIRSVIDLTASNYTITPTNTLVNRPVVASGSTIGGGNSLPQAWYRGQTAFYADFGINPDTVSQVYILITGLDPSGNPLPVSGQQNIFLTIPGLPDYSAFCLVNFITVPQGYIPDTLKSSSAALASGYSITTMNRLVNYPIISPAATPAPSSSPSPLPSPSPASSPIISPTGP